MPDVCARHADLRYAPRSARDLMGDLEAALQCDLHRIYEPGASFWPLLSSRDGIHWTEIGQKTGDEVHTLRLDAGSSFWIYGPDIGGGGNDIEVLPDTLLGYSTDGINWQNISMPQAALGFDALDPVTGFVHIAGETIFISGNNNPAQWIGTIQTE